MSKRQKPIKQYFASKKRPRYSRRGRMQSRRRLFQEKKIYQRRPGSYRRYRVKRTPKSYTTYLYKAQTVFQSCLQSYSRKWCFVYVIKDILRNMRSDKYLCSLVAQYREVKIDRLTLVPVVRNFVVEESINYQSTDTIVESNWQIVPFDDTYVCYRYFMDSDSQLGSISTNPDIFRYSKAVPKGKGHRISTKICGPFSKDAFTLCSTGGVNDAALYFKRAGWYRLLGSDNDGYLQCQPINFKLYQQIEGGTINLLCGKEDTKLYIEGVLNFYVTIKLRGIVLPNISPAVPAEGSSIKLYDEMPKVVASSTPARVGRDLENEPMPFDDVKNLFIDLKPIPPIHGDTVN